MKKNESFLKIILCLFATYCTELNSMDIKKFNIKKNDSDNQRRKQVKTKDENESFQIAAVDPAIKNISLLEAFMSGQMSIDENKEITFKDYCYKQVQYKITLTSAKELFFDYKHKTIRPKYVEPAWNAEYRINYLKNLNNEDKLEIQILRLQDFLSEKDLLIDAHKTMNDDERSPMKTIKNNRAELVVAFDSEDVDRMRSACNQKLYFSRYTPLNEYIEYLIEKITTDPDNFWRFNQGHPGWNRLYDVFRYYVCCNVCPFQP